MAMMDYQVDVSDDSLTAHRARRADAYFNEHLDDQRGWYNKKATKYKKYSLSLAFAVLAAGGLTTFVQLFQSDDAPYRWPIIVTCLLSVIVVLAKGLERIGNFEETWLSYRKASERMKREYRLYINGAGPYRSDANDEAAAYLRFVDNVEEIIAEEQQLYWQSRSDEGKDQSDKSITT